MVKQRLCVAVYCFPRNIWHRRHRIKCINNKFIVCVRNCFSCLRIGHKQSHSLGRKNHFLDYQTHRLCHESILFPS